MREGRAEEAARYRRAAEEALAQVEWCAEYLRRIHRHQLAARLAKNSRYIRKKLM